MLLGHEQECQAKVKTLGPAVWQNSSFLLAGNEMLATFQMARRQVNQAAERTTAAAKRYVDKTNNRHIYPQHLNSRQRLNNHLFGIKAQYKYTRGFTRSFR